MSRLRVCIDARLPDGPYEGLGAVIRGFLGAISELDDSGEEYLLLAYRDSHEWLRPYVKGPVKLLLGPPAPATSKLRLHAKKMPVLGRVIPLLPPSRRLPMSDGTVERAAVDLVHFITPSAFTTKLPSIYQPHDLQHLHYPEFFTRRARLRREHEYRAFCRQAAAVVVMSSGGKEDLIRRYQVPPSKIAVIPWAAAINDFHQVTPEQVSHVRQAFDLPEAFLFYPAHTWRHKNHVGLLQAIAMLRDRDGLRVPVVCAGPRDDFYRQIQRYSDLLQLSSQVRFLGFVSAEDLRALYRAALGVVFPSKFEGWGIPLMEGFAAGTPVACSRISPLREQAKDAALMFDPFNPEEIAATVCRLWTDAELREQLIMRGRDRSSLFRWDRIVLSFRALYRKIAGRILTSEELILLAETPVV